MTYQQLMAAVSNLVGFVLRMGALASFGAILYYGFRMVVAGSDETAYGNARKGLNWAIVGALVIFGVYTIIATVRGAVESIGG